MLKARRVMQGGTVREYVYSDGIVTCTVNGKLEYSTPVDEGEFEDWVRQGEDDGSLEVVL